MQLQYLSQNSNSWRTTHMKDRPPRHGPPRTFCFLEPFCFLAGLGLSSPSGVMGPPFSSAGRFLLFFADPSTAWSQAGRSHR